MSPETLHILLIEDNDEHAKLIARHLSRGSYGAVDLTREATLGAGLQRMREIHVDALLLDLRLPDSDLGETLPKTLEASPQLPIIVLSSLEDRNLAIEAIHSGAQDYLVKSSISDELLIRSIRNAIERKRIESSAKKAKEEAEQANAAKDRFFAALSHELRTPLTPALMICSAMEANEHLQQCVRDSIAKVRRSLEVEKLLINDLLDFTQISQGKIELRREPIDLQSILNHVIELFVENETKAKRVAFQSIFTASTSMVSGDPMRLEQVLSNLCRNALKFTPEGGTILLRSFNPRPGRIAIEVIDSGIGIEAADLARLSRAYEQGNISPNFGGLGLGLMISRTIVEAHGGSFSITSLGKNQGATMLVELDVFDSHSSQTRVPAGKPPPPEKLQILLVEDHAMTRKTLTRILARQNYTVHEAQDVASAKQTIDRGGVNLLISDIGLPDGTGREVMRYAKERLGIKGIAFSGFGMEQDIKASHQAGFSEHLTKPVEWPLLHAAILRTTPHGR